MADPAEPTRAPEVVLREVRPALALEATRRLYREQPELWSLGERGRARTLEDFGHHLGALTDFSPERFAEHVRYCVDLFTHRGFPLRWLEDAWRILDAVLTDELPAPVRGPACATLTAGLARAQAG